MKISIVIPNWNGEEKLKRNLPTVLKVTGVDEVMVVDDASTDGSVKIIEESFPQVKLIKKIKNSGFSSTVNLGVRESRSDLVFLLNSDAVPAEDCLAAVLPHFKDPTVFSVGCNTGGSWAWAKFKDGFFWHGQAKEKPQKAHQTLWVSGGSGVFRKSIWEKLGGLDELFDPFYEEDVDLGYRATKKGYINLWEPNSVVEHYQEKGVIEAHFSKSRVARVAQRNQLFFIWKNITSQNYFRQHLIALLRMLVTRLGYWRVFSAAVIHLADVMRKRETEKKEMVLSDEEVLGKFQLSL